MNVSLCPCGSSQPFSNCCDRFISGNKVARTPEQLMRSRYSAYSMGNIDYIEHTMRGAAIENFNSIEAKHWAKSVSWLGLNVIKAAPAKEQSIGFVTFFACYTFDNVRQYIYEKSEFHRIENIWYYVDGTALKLSLNSMCLCDSGNKAKRCCAQSAL